MSDCKHEWDYDTSGGPGVRWCPRCNKDEDCATSLMQAEAEVERLKGKLLEEARWVYDTGQRAKDAHAEVERLREVVGQVHALANEAVRGTAVWEPLVEIHEITKGMVE